MIKKYITFGLVLILLSGFVFAQSYSLSAVRDSNRGIWYVEYDIYADANGNAYENEVTLNDDNTIDDNLVPMAVYNASITLICAHEDISNNLNVPSCLNDSNVLLVPDALISGETKTYIIAWGKKVLPTETITVTMENDDSATEASLIGIQEGEDGCKENTCNGNFDYVDGDGCTHWKKTITESYWSWQCTSCNGCWDPNCGCVTPQKNGCGSGMPTCYVGPVSSGACGYWYHPTNTVTCGGLLPNSGYTLNPSLNVNGNNAWSYSGVFDTYENTTNAKQYLITGSNTFEFTQDTSYGQINMFFLPNYPPVITQCDSNSSIINPKRVNEIITFWTEGLDLEDDNVALTICANNDIATCVPPMCASEQKQFDAVILNNVTCQYTPVLDGDFTAYAFLYDGISYSVSCQIDYGVIPAPISKYYIRCVDYYGNVMNYSENVSTEI